MLWGMRAAATGGMDFVSTFVVRLFCTDRIACQPPVRTLGACAPAGCTFAEHLAKGQRTDVPSGVPTVVGFARHLERLNSEQRLADSFSTGAINHRPEGAYSVTSIMPQGCPKTGAAGCSQSLRIGPVPAPQSGCMERRLSPENPMPPAMGRAVYQVRQVLGRGLLIDLMG